MRASVEWPKRSEIVVLVGETTPVPREPQGPALERTVTLTDAVVAIAMTLLVLPLVEVSGEVDANHLREFTSEHGNLLLSFIISFLVIYVFWAAHGSAFARLHEAQGDVDELEGPAALRQLNMWWLLVIAFLPFPTALAGRDLTTSSGSFYLGTMAVLSVPPPPSPSQWTGSCPSTAAVGGRGSPRSCSSRARRCRPSTPTSAYSGCCCSSPFVSWKDVASAGAAGPRPVRAR